MLNLGYDMFDELKHNMNRADAFANLLNCTRLSKFTGRDVEAVNEIRFELDESDVRIVVDYAYSDFNEDEINDVAIAEESVAEFVIDEDCAQGLTFVMDRS